MNKGSCYLLRRFSLEIMLILFTRKMASYKIRGESKQNNGIVRAVCLYSPRKGLNMFKAKLTRIIL